MTAKGNLIDELKENARTEIRDEGDIKVLSLDRVIELVNRHLTPPTSPAVKDSQPKEVEINKRDENREIINKIMKDINILSFKNCNGDKCIKTHQVNKSLEKYLTPEIVTSKD